MPNNPQVSPDSDTKTRARKIKLLLFDVDGVLTDGKIWLFPAPANATQATAADRERHGDQAGYGIQSATMMEAKGFHAHDGTAISLLRLGGIKTGLITKRVSDTVALRARDLKLDYVYQGIADKLGAFAEILKAESVTAEEVGFVGDDIIDLPVMRRCGLAVAVANAREIVKDEAHVITDHAGGDGALRDAVEYILRAQGKLDEIIAEYIQERDSSVKQG